MANQSKDEVRQRLIEIWETFTQKSSQKDQVLREVIAVDEDNGFICLYSFSQILLKKAKTLIQKIINDLASFKNDMFVNSWRMDKELWLKNPTMYGIRKIHEFIVDRMKRVFEDAQLFKEMKNGISEEPNAEEIKILENKNISLYFRWKSDLEWGVWYLRSTAAIFD